MKKISETALISGLQEGGIKRQLFETRLYEHFLHFVKKGVRKYGLKEDECASAYSDTIIVVIDNIVKGRFQSKSSLKTYAYSIFKYKCVDEVRKKTTNKGKVNSGSVKIDHFINILPDLIKDIIQKVIYESDRQILKDKMKELSEKCRKLLLLFDDGYSDKEIAEQMDYKTAEVVKTTRLRCLEKLREKVFTEKQNG